MKWARLVSWFMTWCAVRKITGTYFPNHDDNLWHNDEKAHVKKLLSDLLTVFCVFMVLYWFVKLVLSSLFDFNEDYHDYSMVYRIVFYIGLEAVALGLCLFVMLQATV